MTATAAPGPRPPVPSPASRAVVAAFDFDGTLTHGGSVWRFLVALRGRRRVIAAGTALAPRLAGAVLFGGAATDSAKEALFERTLAGLGATDTAARAAEFGIAHYHRRARAEVRERLEWHRSQGHALVIVSASPEIYLRPVGDELAVDAVIGTRLAVGADGRLTGRYDGSNCRGAQKLERVRHWMTQRSTVAGAGAPLLWAYGNSDGDRQLLAGADVGVDAGRLGRLGALRGFARLGDVGGGKPD